MTGHEDFEKLEIPTVVFFNGGEDMIYLSRQIMVLLLITAFLTTSTVVPAAKSATIDTSTYLNTTVNPTKAELESLINREDIRNQLTALGVNPDDAAARIASLTPAELSQLQANMDELPAGANVLAILGGLLLVLIILELLGVTNVFTKL